MTQPVVTGAARLSRSPAVLWEELDGEIVAWCPERKAVHLLDVPAAAVFVLLDGTMALHEVAGVLSERFGADRATVQRDVEELVVRLLGLELLTGAAP